MPNDTLATITVYEKDYSGQDQVDEFSMTLDKGTGTHMGTWSRPESLLMQDTQKDQDQGETGPLEYIFKVAASGTESELSPILMFSKDIEIEFQNEDQSSDTQIGDGTIVELRDPFNDYFEAEVVDSKVLFPQVLLGASKFKKRNLVPGQPVLYDLTWSLSRVPVGSPVNAIFRARNFKDGERATINIYESDPDGEKQLISSLKLKIENKKTEYEIKFIRNENEANSDLAQDKISGDTRPLSYIFEVIINNNKSLFSSSLNLTTEVEIEIGDKSTENDNSDQPEKKTSYLVECIQANGVILNIETTEKKVNFVEVLVGPTEFHITPLSGKAENDNAKNETELA